MKNNTNNNATIIAGNGQHVSYNTIYKAVRQTVDVYNKSKYRSIPEYDIPEVVQEAVARAWQARDSYDSAKSTVETWSSAIAKNCIKDYWSGRAKHEGWGYDKIQSYSDNEFSDIEDEYCTYSIGTKSAPSVENLYADSNPFDDVCKNETKAWLSCHIKQLPENSQFVIEQTLKGSKPAQIAAMLGCTSNAVSIILHRAIKALRDMAQDDPLMAA